MSEGTRRFSIRQVLDRIESVWTGSDLELEIRAGVPGRFLVEARQGRNRDRGTLRYWQRLSGFLDAVVVS